LNGFHAFAVAQKGQAAGALRFTATDLSPAAAKPWILIAESMVDAAVADRADKEIFVAAVYRKQLDDISAFRERGYAEMLIGKSYGRLIQESSA
jgi:hypothetical protein